MIGEWRFRRRWDSWRKWKRVMQGPVGPWEVAWKNVDGNYNGGIDGDYEELVLQVTGDVTRRGWFIDRVEYGVLLAETPVWAVRVERNMELYWHIPKNLSVIIRVGNPLRVTNIRTTYPKVFASIHETMKNPPRTKELPWPGRGMRTAMVRVLDTITINFPDPLVSFIQAEGGA